jgi:hypothetical protein
MLSAGFPHRWCLPRVVALSVRVRVARATVRNYYLVFDLARRQIGWGAVSKKADGCGSIAEGEVAHEHVATAA